MADEVRLNRGKKERRDDGLVVEGVDGVDEIQVKGAE